MNDLVPMEQSSDGMYRKKNFFFRPEGKTGVVFLAIGVAIAMAIIAKSGIVGLMADMVWDAVSLGCALGVLIAGYLILTSKKLRALFMAASWHFHNAFIKSLDPEGILRGYLRRMKDHIDILKEKLSGVSGFVNRFNGLVKKTQQEIDDAQALVIAARNEGNELVLQEAADKLNIVERENAEYREQLEMFKNIYEALWENTQYAESFYRRTESRLTSLLRSRNALKEVYGFVQSCRAILNGDEMKEIADISEEKALSESARFMGYFDTFVRETAPLIEAQRLQKKANVVKALGRIESIEKSNQPLLLESKQHLGRELVMPNRVKEPAAVVSGKKDPFEKLAKKSS